MNSVELSRNLYELFEMTSDFNPSNNEGIKAFKEYQFLVEQIAEGAKAFLAQDVAKFDPNIGDCACQIRTVKTVLLARDGMVFAEMQKLMNQSIRIAEACESILNACKAKKAQGNNQMSDLRSDLKLSMSEDVAYLVQAYFIMLMQENLKNQSSKKDDPFFMNIKMVPSQLSVLSKGRISTGRAGKISSFIRRNLSRAARDFIRSQAEISQKSLFIKACSELYTQKVQGTFYSVMVDLYSVPMFYSCQILMKTCRREGIPVVFKVKLYDKDSLTEKSPIGTEYVRLKFVDEKVTPASPFCVFEGVRQDSRHNLNNSNTFCNNTLAFMGQKVIFAGAAAHPQYVGGEEGKNFEELEAEVKESRRLDQFAARARAVGCSKSNPSLFFIQHVYPQSGQFLLKEGCPPAVLGIREEGVVDV